MNGVAGDLPLDEAWDVAMMLVKLRRAVHPGEWVDELVAGRQADALERIY